MPGMRIWNPKKEKIWEIKEFFLLKGELFVPLSFSNKTAVSALAGVFLFLSVTSSTPTMRPLPLTSPMTETRFYQGEKNCKIKLPFQCVKHLICIYSSKYSIKQENFNKIYVKRLRLGRICASAAQNLIFQYDHVMSIGPLLLNISKWCYKQNDLFSMPHENLYNKNRSANGFSTWYIFTRSLVHIILEGSRSIHEHIGTYTQIQNSNMTIVSLLRKFCLGDLFTWYKNMVK